MKFNLTNPIPTITKSTDPKLTVVETFDNLQKESTGQFLFYQSVSVTTSEDWSFSDSITLGISESTTLDVTDPELPFISAQETVTISVSNPTTKVSGGSTSKTEIIELKQIVSVPAKVSGVVTGQISKGTISMPYTGIVNYKGKDHTIEGSYTASNVYDQEISVALADQLKRP